MPTVNPKSSGRPAGQGTIGQRLGMFLIAGVLAAIIGMNFADLPGWFLILLGILSTALALTGLVANKSVLDHVYDGFTLGDCLELLLVFLNF